MVRRFGFSTYIVFYYVSRHSVYRCIVKTIYLEKPKRLTILNRGSIVSQEVGSRSSWVYKCVLNEGIKHFPAPQLAISCRPIFDPCTIPFPFSFL